MCIEGVTAVTNAQLVAAELGGCWARLEVPEQAVQSIQMGFSSGCSMLLHKQQIRMKVLIMYSLFQILVCLLCVLVMFLPLPLEQDM